PSFASFVLFVMMGYLFYLFAYTVLSQGKINFAQSAEIFVTGLYIALSFSAFVMLRDQAEVGQYIYLIIFIAAWISDSCAYICGTLFGRHKLIPAISPHKTVEGSVGGILGCILSMVLYGVIISALGGPAPNYLFLAVSGLILSVCAQIGDLIASLIKREHGIKDYGKLFPGHGGVMDRFDSNAAVAIVLLLLCALPEMGLFRV
ncbi:MAG: CDP-archaeol synthase, partial [Clostridia bacterium]|nr:CDP-archaeol synthase [Clostridia bacterium]